MPPARITIRSDALQSLGEAQAMLSPGIRPDHPALVALAVRLTKRRKAAEVERAARRRRRQVRYDGSGA